MEQIRHVAKRDSRLHGVLVVDKPGLEQPDRIPLADDSQSSRAFPRPITKEATVAGTVPASPHRRLPTSHDVVQKVRQWSMQRRIGHTGTLDPMASGILVLCLGHATRLAEYYQGHDKQYYAEVALGAATDTYDAVGKVTSTGPVVEHTRELVEHALDGFRGPIQQTPPIFSALKVGGESLHRKARRQETVSLQPRPVVVHRLDLLDYMPGDRICLRIVCSAGTYIRSLAHELGRALGTHAHLAMLRREAAGPFHLDKSHKLDAVQQAADEDRLVELLLPLGHGLDFPIVRLTVDQTLRFGFGQKVVLRLPPDLGDSPDKGLSQVSLREDVLAQALGDDGEFAGLIRYLGRTDNQGSIWKAEKWLTNT